ncbi:extensin-like [Rhincodon typus]|uniref:extensin-like n=1 Tax=Rhincodon typus TaxID=259920 RepID=UPI00202E19ED|nr:extensin-like [Rhincodon typus]
MSFQEWEGMALLQEASAPSRIPAKSLSQPRPGPAQANPGPSTDHHRKPSLRLSPPTPAPKLTETFAPTWTLTLNPPPDTKPVLDQTGPTQSRAPDQTITVKLALHSALRTGRRPQPSAPVPAVTLNPAPDPSHQPVAVPTRPQLVTNTNPNPRLSWQRPPVLNPNPNPRLSRPQPPDTDPSPQPSARSLSRPRSRQPAPTLPHTAQMPAT